MEYVYFPACRYTALSARNSMNIQIYLRQIHHMQICGCCTADYPVLTADTAAVTICPTCTAILREQAPQAAVLSIWEFLLEDLSFPWPDYKGKELMVQDCWRSRDDRACQEAVRAVLKRMNIVPIEMEDNFEKTKFCGISLLCPPTKEEARLAPELTAHWPEEKYKTREERIAAMQDYGRGLDAKEIVCYCNECMEGIRLAGKKGVHLMDLAAKNL